MSLKLSFWIRPSLKNNKRKSPIYLKIHLNNIRTSYSVGEFINYSLWDKKSQRLKGNTPEVQVINEKLDALSTMSTLYLEYQWYFTQINYDRYFYCHLP
jgi:hypothetical protein